jgi:hypothetical protein
MVGAFNEGVFIARALLSFVVVASGRHCILWRRDATTTAESDYVKPAMGSP